MSKDEEPYLGYVMWVPGQSELPTIVKICKYRNRVIKWFWWHYVGLYYRLWSKRMWRKYNEY
jgi:hypothetical protein